MLAGTEYVRAQNVSAAGCIGSSDSSVSLVTEVHSGRSRNYVSILDRDTSCSSFSIAFRPVLRSTQLHI